MEELNAASYYIEREQHSLMLAKAAVNPAVAAIHYDLAARYAELTITAAARDLASSTAFDASTFSGDNAHG